MGKIKNLLRNKWVGFTLAALLYTLWFVVWIMEGYESTSNINDILENKGWNTNL